MKDVKDILYETISKISEKNDSLKEENEKLKKQLLTLKEQSEDEKSDTEPTENEIIQAIKDFLIKTEEPTDEQIHGLAEEIGIEHEKLEEAVYKMLRDYIVAESEEETDRAPVDVPASAETPDTNTDLDVPATIPEPNATPEA